MSCKIWEKNEIYIVSVFEIRLNAKFKAELDIFLKLGTKKEELLMGLSIENGKVKLPEIMKLENMKQFYNQINQGNTGKSVRLVFELRSKSYNAYAGQVEIDLKVAKNEKIRHETKIEYCIDVNASILYEVVAIPEEKGKTDLVREAKERDKKNEKSPTKQRKHQLKKKRSFRQQNLKPLMTIKSPTKHIDELNKKCLKPPQLNQLNQKFTSYRSSPRNLLQSPSNIIKAKKKILTREGSNIQMEEQSFDMGEISSFLEKSSKTKKINNQTVCNGQNTVKIIELKNKLYEEKQKFLKLELELQKSKNEIKELIKNSKVTQNRLQLIEADIKKARHQQIILKSQNKSIQQSHQAMAQKLAEKTEQLGFLKSRNQQYEKSYKEQLENVYQKLETIHLQKQQNNYEKLTLEERWEHVQKKHSYQLQKKQLNHQLEKGKLLATIQRRQKQCKRVQTFLDRFLTQFGQQIELIFRNQSKVQFSFENFQQENRYFTPIRDIVSKVQRVRLEIFSRLNDNKQTVNRQQLQLRQLKVQARQLSKDYQNIKEQFDTEKLNHKKSIRRFEDVIEQQKQVSNHQINQLKSTLQRSQTQISSLNQKIIATKKEIAAIKIDNQKYEQTIAQRNQLIHIKTQDFNNKINALHLQKNQLTQQLRNSMNQLQIQLQKQQVITNQLTFKNQTLIRTIFSLQNQTSSLNQQLLKYQNQLKQTYHSASLILQSINQFINIIHSFLNQPSKKYHSPISIKNPLQNTSSFQEKLKNFQQTKQITLNQLQKIISQIITLRQEKVKQEQEYKKLELIFNLNQKSKNTLKSCIINMKKQNEDLKTELNKRKSFESQIHDEFKCSIHDLRERLIVYKNEHDDLSGIKANYERQANKKTKKLYEIIESLNYDMNIVQQHQQWVQIQFGKIFQTTLNVKKFMNANDIVISHLINVKPIKDAIDSIQNVLNLIGEKFSQTKSVFMVNRKVRSRNSVSIRRIQNNNSLDKTILMKRPSIAIKNTSTQNEIIEQQLSTKTNNEKNNSNINCGLKIQTTQSTKNSRSSNLLTSIQEREQEQCKKVIKEIKKNEQKIVTEKDIEKDNKLNKVTSLKNLQTKITPFRQLRQKYTDKKSKNSLSARSLKGMPISKCNVLDKGSRI